MMLSNLVRSSPRSGVLAPVETHRLGGVAKPDQPVAERRVGQLVAEVQPDQRAADPERHHGGEEHVDECHPEQSLGKGQAEQRYIEGQVPQDRVKAITVDTESIAPNSSTDPVPIVGEFGMSRPRW